MKPLFYTIMVNAFIYLLDFPINVLVLFLSASLYHSQYIYCNFTEVFIWNIASNILCMSYSMFLIIQGGIRCLYFIGNELATGSWDTTVMVCFLILTVYFYSQWESFVTSFYQEMVNLIVITKMNELLPLNYWQIITLPFLE